jgi:hypothetical protein
MRRVSRLAWWLACIFSVVSGLSFAGPEAPQGSGRFESKGSGFEVAGAYAFPARVGLDDEEGIKVAISNAGFRAEGVNRTWDREAFIDARFADEDTLVAYLHFGMTGKYLGASWYFGPGDGCAFCSSSTAASSVKVAGGRIAGRVALKEEDTAYDVTFDVPVAPKLPGELLPAGPGEAGTAYLAYHKALTKADKAAVLRLLTAEDRERYVAAEQKGGDFMAYLGKDHPAEVSIVRAFQEGEWATLLVRGKAYWGKLHGEVQMRRENGSWCYWDELFGVGDWPEGRRP